MPLPEKAELDARAYNGHWCEHCRCQVHYSRITNTKNHINCGKGPVEYIPLVLIPFRDFAS